MRPLKELLTDDGGATAVEYGLLVMTVSLACLSTWVAMGPEVRAPFETVLAEVANVNAGG